MARYCSRCVLHRHNPKRAVRCATAFLLALVMLVRGQGPELPSVAAAAALELYGTFNAMGVIATIGATDDPNLNATANVQYRSGSAPYQAGYPLARVSPQRFVGSLFWLEPGTSYDVRVVFADPDDGPLNGVVSTASASSRPEITIPSPMHSLYASPNGGGSACSVSAPCALATAIDAAQAGDAVFLRGGTYYEGDFNLVRSGAPGAPIVIRSYPGENAIMDGSDPTVYTWVADGGGVYHTTVQVAGPHMVLAGGQRLFPYTTLAALQSLSVGVPGFYANGTVVYVQLANGADPNSATLVISRFHHAFDLESQSHIYLTNLTFRYYGQGEWSKTIYLIDASDNFIQGNTFISNDVGVAFKYDSHRNLIQDNVFYDTIFDWPWESVKQETGGTIEDGGIYVYDLMSGRGNVIRRNIFHDDFDGMHICPESGAVSPTNEMDVYENQIYRMDDDGMETDGYCSNLRIWNNTVHDTLMGISLAPVHIGPVYAIRNLIYRTGTHDQYGSSFKFNVGDVAPSGPMYLFHNTADGGLPDQNGLTIFEPQTWAMILARNNAWTGTAYAIENYNISQPIDLDYDNLWTSRGGALVRWDNVERATLAELRVNTGQEEHGLSAPPGFANASGGDYRLLASSPLINAGIILPGINDRGPYAYRGSAPDIGAFESTGPLTFSGRLYLPLALR